jgi:hypothetical protein
MALRMDIWSSRPGSGYDSSSRRLKMPLLELGTSVPGNATIDHGCPTMDRASLRSWAEARGEGAVEDHPDYPLALTSQLLRFRWKGGMAVGVGSDAAGKVRINAVLDGASWFIARGEPSDTTLHVVLGTVATGEPGSLPKEHLDAIATLVAELRAGPQVRVWSIAPGEDPVELALSPPAFTTATALHLNAMLMSAAVAPISGMAAALVEALPRHRSPFALYPKLAALKAAQPWQMRLDGLDIGRTGANGTTLSMAGRYAPPGEPRDTWRKIVGQPSKAYSSTEMPDVVRVIRELVAA